MSDIDDLTFEQALSELEALVQEMEGGNLELDRALQLFERGMALAAHCNDRLDSAELRVRQLAPNGTSAPFEPPPSPEEG
jgi:exodeoxyribonuclease VII small subunit